MRYNPARGQIGLMLLVIMGVVVALVMSIASRSLSDTVLSRQERESSAAFSLAETGVEQAMSFLGQGTVPDGVINIPTTLDIVDGQYKVLPTTSYGLFVREGETANLDVDNFSGDLTISWTKKADKTENVTTCHEGSGFAPAAIAVSRLNDTSVKHEYFNPNQNGLTCALGTNGFSNAAIDGGDNYRSSTTVNIVTGTMAVRIKPIYNGATIEVSGTNLKNQLYLIQSKATTGDTQREIEVKRGLDAPPAIFDFAVFSGGTIVK